VKARAFGIIRRRVFARPEFPNARRRQAGIGFHSVLDDVTEVN
jgi:hypothetical protein